MEKWNHWLLIWLFHCNLFVFLSEEIKTIDRLTAEYLQNIFEYTAEEKYDRISQIRKYFKKALDYGDDKVQLAMQTYEMVCVCTFPIYHTE